MKCKFCIDEEPGIIKLREHVKGNHPVEYDRIQAWVHGLDEKVLSFQRLADEALTRHEYTMSQKVET